MEFIQEVAAQQSREMISPEQISQEEIQRYFWQITERLRMNESESKSVKEFGFANTSSIKDVYRQTFYYLIEQLSGVSIDLDNITELFSRLNHNPIFETELYKVLYYWHQSYNSQEESLIPKNYSAVINSGKQFVRNYFEQQTRTHFGELGYKQTVSDYPLTKSYLSKLVIGGNNSIAAHNNSSDEFAAEREIVEQSNMGKLLVEGHCDFAKTKILCEVSPPIHDYQTDLMVRLYKWDNNQWQAKVITLPYFPSTGIDDCFRLQNNLAEFVTTHGGDEVTQRKILDGATLNKAENQILEQVYAIDADSLDLENFAQLITYFYSDGEIDYLKIARESAEIVTEINNNLGEIEPFTNSLADELPTLLESNVLEQKANTLHNLLIAATFSGMSEEKLAEQDWNSDEARSLKAGIFQAALSDSAPTSTRMSDFIHSVGGGKGLSSQSTSECGGISANFSPSVSQTGQKGEILLSKEPDIRNGVPWQTVLKNGELVERAMCSCGLGKGSSNDGKKQYWFDPCNPNDKCPYCHSTCKDQRLFSEKGGYTKLRQQFEDVQHQRTNGREESTWLANAFEGFFGIFIPNYQYNLIGDANLQHNFSEN